MIHIVKYRCPHCAQDFDTENEHDEKKCSKVMEEHEKNLKEGEFMNAIFTGEKDYDGIEWEISYENDDDMNTSTTEPEVLKRNESNQIVEFKITERADGSRVLIYKRK